MTERLMGRGRVPAADVLRAASDRFDGELRIRVRGSRDESRGCDGSQLRRTPPPKSGGRKKGLDWTGLQHASTIRLRLSQKEAPGRRPAGRGGRRAAAKYGSSPSWGAVGTC